MKTKTRTARAFYLVASDLQTISRPFDRMTNRADATAEAKRRGNRSQVVSASEYRELTGRIAARDFAAEMNA